MELQSHFKKNKAETVQDAGGTSPAVRIRNIEKK